jgi:hypothetical protein
MQQMMRAAVFALALAGLAVLAVGVFEAVPLVNWGTTEELASIDHGRSKMLVGVALLLVAAVAARDVRIGTLFAVAALLPAALVLLTPGTAFGLLALPVALGAGIAGAIAVVARRAQPG